MGGYTGDLKCSSVSSLPAPFYIEMPIEGNLPPLKWGWFREGQNGALDSHSLTTLQVLPSQNPLPFSCWSIGFPRFLCAVAASS